jgi:UDP-hydrolysing UDP-N-acetyl-D-glucosamine 2-epimerase
MPRKILAITGSRADYDLMSALYMQLHADPDCELKLLVAGGHMSATFGSGVEWIRRDGLEILLALETLIDSDSVASRLKSTAILLQGVVDIVAQYQPDLILYPGDREEVMVGALLGAYLEIPTVHFFGGDHTQDGHVDNPVRHATSKLSTVHMVSLEQHRQRLLSMGEPPGRIFNIGSIALDRFVQHQPCSTAELWQHFGCAGTPEPFALVIFHPVVEEKEHAHHYLAAILEALLQRGLRVFVGAPNSDPMNRGLFAVAERYAAESRVVFYRALERELFLSLYKRSALIIGNSSSGIIEAASVPVPAINVGARQRGRFAGDNVLFCAPDADAIGQAIDRAMHPAFRAVVHAMVNPYGDGQSVRRALELLRSVDFRAMLYKKEDPLAFNRQFAP